MPSGHRQRYNLFSTTLGASLAPGDTTITFGDTPPFATLGTDEVVALTINDVEVVHLTSYTAAASTGTISRGEEGTTAASHSAGVSVVHGPTKDDFPLSAVLGHPAQEWSYHASAFPMATQFFEWAFDPGDGSGYRGDFEEVTYQRGDRTFGLPVFGGDTAALAHLPERFRLILRWHAPYSGTFNLDYAGENGNFDFTVTTNGVADTLFTNTTGGTYTIAVPAGDNEVEVVIENNTGAATGSALQIKPYVTSDVAPQERQVFFDEVSGQFIAYLDGGYIPVSALRDALVGGGNPFRSYTSLNISGRNAVGSTLPAPYETDAYSVNLLGIIAATSDASSYNAVIGHECISISFPDLGGAAGYGGYAVAIGKQARAWPDAIAIGENADAGPLGITLAGEAGDECVALGYGAVARVSRAGAVPGGSTSTAVAPSGNPGAYGVTAYHIRGVDTDGYPMTTWTSVGTENLDDQHVDLTWPTSGWPVGTTDVQVRRKTSSEEYTYLTGTVASGALTDDFGVWDRIPAYVSDDVAFVDWYGWDRERRGIAIGLYTTASHQNSVVIDNDQSSSEYDDQFMLGNDGNLVDTKGGVVHRVESVSAAHVCDSNGKSHIVVADVTGGGYSVTLPAAQDGRTLVVKKTSGGNTLTVATPGAETIDGAASLAITTAYGRRRLVSDGTNWFTI